VNSHFQVSSFGKKCEWISLNITAGRHYERLAHKLKSVGLCMHEKEFQPIYAHIPVYYTVVCEDDSHFMSFRQSYDFIHELASYPSIDNNHGIKDSHYHNKPFNISFVGDSTLRQQFYHLICMLDQNVTKSYETFHNYTGNDRPHFMNATLGNVKVSYYDWGRHFSKDFINIFKYDFNKVMNESTPNDIIVMNAGLHFDWDINTLVKTTKMMIAMYSSMKENMAQNMPHVIWRDSSPQNLPSPNGWYMNGLCKQLGNCTCVNLTETMIDGGGSGVPANKRNTLTLPLLRNTGIVIDECYEALIGTQPVSNIHEGTFINDCTHLGMNGVTFQNQVLLTSIEALFHTKLPNGPKL